jgi:hypothetical protein
LCLKCQTIFSACFVPTVSAECGSTRNTKEQAKLIESTRDKEADKRLVDDAYLNHALKLAEEIKKNQT